MAIQIAVTTPDGVSHPTAYARCVYGQIDYENSQAVLIVKVYDTAAARQGNLQPVAVRTYNIGPDKFNTYFADAVLKTATPATEAYTYLAGHPDYVGGVMV